MPMAKHHSHWSQLPRRRCGVRKHRKTALRTFQGEVVAPIHRVEGCAASPKRGLTTFVKLILNQERGEPFRRDAMKKLVVVAAFGVNICARKGSGAANV